jgi:uncharacterized membrane protein YkvA (DUF1232 family)
MQRPPHHRLSGSQKVRLIWRLLNDPRVGKKKWILPVAAILYFFFPFDFDWVVMIGWLDDLGLIALAIRALSQLPRRSPRMVVTEHEEAIEAEYEDQKYDL